MTQPYEGALDNPEQLSNTEKANIAMDQQFYGVTEEEDLNGLNFLDADETALLRRIQS